MTEPTPKPTDALDLLYLLAGGVDPEKCSPFQAMAREWAIEAAEAWEKERATLNEVGELFNEAQVRIRKMELALERIEGEIIEEPEEIGPDEHGYCWKYDRATLAARLRAAREGGK